MNINRHNYEEYFILYMDNEMSPGERRQVEDFVQHHPDLKEELDLLLQYKLTPDPELVFPGKEELLKGTEAVDLAHYEESLLLYIDDELNAEERQAVEQFVAGNEAARTELLLLQQSKLRPEPVHFPHKRSLYRHEVRRIPVLWLRMAAAAVLLLAVSVTAVLVLNRKPAVTGGVADAGKEKPRDQKTTPLNNNSGTTSKDPGKDALVTRQKEPQLITPVSPVNKKEPVPTITQKNNLPVIAKNTTVINPKEKLPVNNIVPPKNNDPIVTDISNNKTNNLPQPLNNPNLSNNQIKDALAVNNKPEEKSNGKDPLTETDVTSPTIKPSDIITASYQPTDPGFDQDANGGKKNKLRGFFRKITRTFEKRTNIDPTTDENKLLVAGLAINLK